MEHNWNGRPYHSLDWELKHTFGHKVYKLSLDAGLTCPNRDGTCGSRGCIFCSEGGSGDFAEHLKTDVWEQIEAAKKQISNKTRSDPLYRLFPVLHQYLCTSFLFKTII